MTCRPTAAGKKGGPFPNRNPLVKHKQIMHELGPLQNYMEIIHGLYYGAIHGRKSSSPQQLQCQKQQPQQQQQPLGSLYIYDLSLRPQVKSHVEEAVKPNQAYSHLLVRDSCFFPTFSSSLSWTEFHLLSKTLRCSRRSGLVRRSDPTSSDSVSTFPTKLNTDPPSEHGSHNLLAGSQWRLP